MALINAVPIVNLPELYVNGLQITNDGTSPNTVLDIGPGQCRDSSNTYDIVLPNTVKLNTSVVGANGIDTGSPGNTTGYAIYVISDPVGGKPTATLLSYEGNAIPQLPQGYEAYRLIGYLATNSGGAILPGAWTAGNSASRSFYYSTPAALTLPSPGTAEVFQSLNPYVPSVNNFRAALSYTYTPNAQNNKIKLAPANAAAYTVVINGQAASVALGGLLQLNTQLLSGLASIAYLLSSASDAIAISVAGYDYVL